MRSLLKRYEFSPSSALAGGIRLASILYPKSGLPKRLVLPATSLSPLEIKAECQAGASLLVRRPGRWHCHGRSHTMSLFNPDRREEFGSEAADYILCRIG